VSLYFSSFLTCSLTWRAINFAKDRRKRKKKYSSRFTGWCPSTAGPCYFKVPSRKMKEPKKSGFLTPVTRSKTMTHLCALKRLWRLLDKSRQIKPRRHGFNSWTKTSCRFSGI